MTTTPQAPIGSGLDSSTTAAEAVAGIDLHGVNVVITGGYAGIGLETTRALAGAGANVLVAGRDPIKAQANIGDIRGVRAAALDLANPKSIDAFANELLSEDEPIDLLINNAGIMATPLLRDARGYEMQFSTNHLGHFQLTKRLMPLLELRGARVISLTSAGHRFAAVDLDDPNFDHTPYDRWKAYGRSKSANSLFAIELDRRMRDRDVRAFAVHPGRILSTELVRYISDEDLIAAGIKRPDGTLDQSTTKTITQGAATTVWCATSPRLENMGGVYCCDCEIAEVVPDDSPSLTGVRSWAIDPDVAAKLWELSEKLIA